MNHYDTLQVSPQASEAVLRAAYKSLMQHHHPDRHGQDPAQAARAAQIAQAYAVLSDPVQRAAYDAQRARSTMAAPAESAAPGAGRTPAAVPRSAAPARTGMGWYPWLLALVMLACTLVLLWPAQPLLPAPVPSPVPAAMRPAPAAAVGPTEPASAPLHYSLLDSAGLQVLLPQRSWTPGSPPEGPYRLSLPALTLVIGKLDGEQFARGLDQQRAQLQLQLAERLSRIDPTRLRLPGEGEPYLNQYLLDILRELTGTAGRDDSAEALRYGITAVALPQSFELH